MLDLPFLSRRQICPPPLVSKPSSGCHAGPSPAPCSCNISGFEPGAIMVSSAKAKVGPRTAQMKTPNRGNMARLLLPMFFSTAATRSPLDHCPLDHDRANYQTLYVLRNHEL